MGIYSRPTYAEIDLGAIKHNIRTIRSVVGPDVRIMPAVKADGYGHGALEVSRAAVEAGADALGVACVEEGLELRAGGLSSPALILGVSTDDAFPEIVAYDLAATVCDLKSATKLSLESGKQGKLARVHLKVDTGMGRIGIHHSEARRLARSISQLPGLSLDGIFTHFPSSDVCERSFTREQITLFSKVISDLEDDGIHIPLKHAANSGGVLDHPESYFNMVRPGIITYGLWPSEDCSRLIHLRSALTLKSAIAFLKDIEPGTTVSYGRTFTALRRTKVATLPIGYADGYNRQLSNRGKAVVRGVVVPVIGRVCMDQIMLDVTDVPAASVGDEVALYGGRIDPAISIESVASMLDTIPYEVTCWISKRVPRVYNR